MRKHIYPRLAAQNLRKNSQYFLPYILTCTVSVCMFFIIYSLSISKSLDNIYGGAQLGMLLNMSMVIAALFFMIFLFYTNSFLTKRRTKEYGLYSVLGMEKKHICIMSLYETLYTAAVSLAGGFALGLLLSKLVYLVLAKLLHFEASSGFDFHKESFLYTVLLFCAIFIVIYINTVRIISKTSAVDLLHGDKTGEKEPKTKLLLTVVGIAALAAGYIIAVTTKSPLEAMGLFVLAAVLVMIGTYCLFTAGSIALLKLLRKNKRYYYKTKHFVGVSGMMHRMKQNAVGLASICILCTAVLIMISTTASLYGGMEELIRTRFPRNFLVSAVQATSQTADRIESVVESEAEKNGINITNFFKYRSLSFTAAEKNGIYEGKGNDNVGSSAITMFTMLLLDDYNSETGKSVQLGENEVLIQPVNGKVHFDSIPFGSLTLNIKSVVDDVGITAGSVSYLVDTYRLVVRDEETAKRIFCTVNGEGFEDRELSFDYNFDTDAVPEKQIAFLAELKGSFEKLDIECFAECAEESRESFYSLYGGLLFIGIFLGFIFMVATVLIIYYKQVSEGYDDRERFEIMQKVGMDKQEVRRCVRSQVLTVFFLPLLAALVHLGFAFPIITRLLAILNLTNIGVFVIGLAVTTVIFAAVYAGVYALTAKAYYRIVT